MLCIETTRFNKLTQIKPNGDPVNPQDLIKNQNILTRFASEFDMMEEMIQFQKGVNQVILGVNNFLGEGPPQNVDRIGAAVGSNQQSSSSSSSTSTVGKFLSPYYGNTVCRVFKRGLQNWKDFCLKINIPKGNY